MRISGFIVVRRPEHCSGIENRFDGEGFIEGNLNIFNKIYRGVDRYAWADLYDADYYGKNVSPEVVGFAKYLEKNDCGGLGREICKSLDAAIRIQDHMNRFGQKNEIIAVYSEVLGSLDSEYCDELAVEWMGFDYFAVGEWSLIKMGVFHNYDAFKQWVNLINPNGLFDSEAYLKDYISTYISASENNVVEAAGGDGGGWGAIAVKVGKVNINR